MVTSGLFWFLRRRNVPVAVAVNIPLNPNAKTRPGSGRLTIRLWVASWGTPITVWWKKIRPRASADFACTCHCILSTSGNGSARGADMLFRPEKQRLLDALWPVLVSFCDAGKHTVGMSVSRLARELSPKDARGEVISGTEVTVRRISALIAEQVRFGVLGVSEETLWDRESRKRLPKYVWITPVGWKMLGVDLMKLQEQQLKNYVNARNVRRSLKRGC